MDPYVPMETGMLADNVDTYVGAEPERSTIAVPTPIISTTAKDSISATKKHPKATAKWDAAMKSERGKDLVAAVQNFVKGRK